MLRIYFTIILFFVFSEGTTQVTFVDQTSYGGSDFDSPSSIVEAPGGGYYVLNYSRSGNSGNMTVSNFGEIDYVLVKYDDNHTIEWQKEYGGTQNDVPTDLYLIDSTLFMMGTSNSSVSGNKTVDTLGAHDIWVVKTDLDGNVIWDKVFGGEKTDLYQASTKLDNGSLLVGSQSYSGATGNKTSPNLGAGDFWMFEMDQNGDYVWEKTLGTDEMDVLTDIVTFQGDIFISGSSQGGINGDKTEPLYGLGDYWVVKTDAAGNKIWDRAMGTTGPDIVSSHLYVSTDSIQVYNNGNNTMSGMRSVSRKGNRDIWNVNLNHNGVVTSQYAYGGNQSEGVERVYSTSEGLLLISSSNSDVSLDKTEDSRGARDFWPILLDQSGNLVWQKTIGGSEEDRLRNFLMRSNNELLLLGSSESSLSGDKTSPAYGEFDTWIVELDITELSTQTESEEVFSVFPNPFEEKIVLRGEYMSEIRLIEMVDARGKVVYSTRDTHELSGGQFSISTRKFSQGAYILNVFTATDKHSFKVLK